jgi:hypothetical protein
MGPTTDRHGTEKENSTVVNIEYSSRDFNLVT